MKKILSKKLFISVLLFTLLFTIGCKKQPSEKSGSENESKNRVIREAFLPTVKIGEYVSIGTLNGEEILWRCVAQDENGKLLISDKIIALLPYDASGIDNSGSHVRANGKKRMENGSDYWLDSNIRSWLNSESDIVDWSCKNPPNAEHTSDGNNSYSEKKGFLNSENFTDTQKKAIKEVTLYSAMNALEYTYPNPDSQSLPDYGYVTDTPDFVEYYYGEEAKEKIFLPDIFQIKHIYNNSEVLGSGYFVGYPSKSVERQNVGNEALSAKKSWYTATRTPSCNDSDSIYIYCVYNENGRYEKVCANTSNIGIRPAFYLNEENAFCVAGSGKADDPYYME